MEQVKHASHIHVTGYAIFMKISIPTAGLKESERGDRRYGVL